MSTVSVVIPTIRGREELLKKLLDSLPKNVERIVVDDEELSLAAKRNKGAKKAKGRYILFIDDDNFLREGSISELARNFNSSTGIVGVVACYDSDRQRIADGGSIRNYFTGATTDNFVNKSVDSLPQMPYEVSEVANAFMMRRQLWRELGGFDEINFPIDLDEADLCRRAIKMGKKIMYCPTAICYHKSITYSRLPDFRRPKNAYYLPRNQILYQRKHSSFIRFWLHIMLFLPVRFCVYTATLTWRKKFSMIPYYVKGTLDGIFNRRTNPF